MLSRETVTVTSEHPTGTQNLSWEYNDARIRSLPLADLKMAWHKRQNIPRPNFNTLMLVEPSFARIPYVVNDDDTMDSLKAKETSENGKKRILFWMTTERVAKDLVVCRSRKAMKMRRSPRAVEEEAVKASPAMLSQEAILLNLHNNKKKAMKSMKAMKAMKASKQKQVGSRLEVWLGKAVRTKWGLKKKDLMLNGRGRLVSRRRSLANKRTRSIDRLAPWMQNVQEARQAIRKEGVDLKGVLVNRTAEGQILFQKACQLRGQTKKTCE